MADNFNENILPEEDDSYSEDEEYMVDEDIAGVKGGSTEHGSGDADEMDEPLIDSDEEEDYTDYSDDV